MTKKQEPEKTVTAPDYKSENPEVDFKRFEDAMKQILSVPKEGPIKDCAGILKPEQENPRK